MSTTCRLINSLKSLLRPSVVMLLNMGFDPRRFGYLRNYKQYRAQYRQFEKLGGVITHKNAILSDYEDEAGSTSGHYFHQDLLVASFIYKRAPLIHVDIGSRIDGFVAHVASFREIQVMDVRHLKDSGHQNISFIKADLMKTDSTRDGITDSISCLHAIEHFGLGRYGDPVDPLGHIKGFNNIVRMLKREGILYVSFPIGRSSEVHFNAHRVFHPRDVFSWAEDSAKLRLERFDYVDDDGNLQQDVDIEKTHLDVVHGCGIYTFTKTC